MERSAELKSGIKVDFGAIWSILGCGKRSKIGIFDQKRGAYKENFAPRRPRRALRGPTQYLERSPELKSGIKVESGAIRSILRGPKSDFLIEKRMFIRKISLLEGPREL